METVVPLEEIRDIITPMDSGFYHLWWLNSYLYSWSRFKSYRGGVEFVIITAYRPLDSGFQFASMLCTKLCLTYFLITFINNSNNSKLYMIVENKQTWHAQIEMKLWEPAYSSDSVSERTVNLEEIEPASLIFTVTSDILTELLA